MPKGGGIICDAIFRCEHIKSIWDHNDFAEILRERVDSSFMELAFHVVHKDGCDKLGVFLCMAWAYWAYRNKQIMAHESAELGVPLHSFLQMLKVYRFYAQGVFPPLTEAKFFLLITGILRPPVGSKLIQILHSLVGCRWTWLGGKE